MNDWEIDVGEEIVEPEVDISSFLERQRLSPQPSSAPPPADDEDEDDIDRTLDHISHQTRQDSKSKKGRVHQIEWDESLEELTLEKAAADAARGASFHDTDPDYAILNRLY